MSKEHIHKALDAIPFGVGRARVLVNNKGEADDCMFLDINPGFERIMG